MANLVDSLILTLKLDSSQFQKGAKESEQSLKKTRETAVGHGKGIETSMRGASDGVNKLTMRFLELYAVLTGGKEIKQFVADVTKNDAAVGRFAANMQMSAKDLQAWQGAVKATGGSAEDASSSIQSFSNQIQAIKAGHPDKNFLLALAQIGGKPINFQAPLNQQIRTLADNLRALYKRDPQFATYMAQQVGMSASMANTMFREKGALEALLAAEQKYAASTADITAAEKRQIAFQLLIAASEQLGRSILTQLTPTILRLSAAIQDFVDKHGNEFRAWFQQIADRIASFPWKELFDDFVGLAKGVDKLVSGTIGWKTALEALIALKAIDVLTPMAVQFGLIALALSNIVGLGPALLAMFGAGGILAAGGALAATLYPQGLNAGEDELARQRRYGQGAAGAPPAPSGEGFKGASPWNRQTGGAPIGGPREGYGAMTDAQVQQTIKEEAAKAGINPALMLGIYRGEGRGGYSGDRGTSFGPFQLHVGGGMGDEAIAAGINIRDAATIREQAAFVAKTLKEHPERIREFHGYHGPWEGGEGAGKAIENATHPRRYQGEMKIGDETFSYASGSERRGRGSSPFGEHPITGFDPSALGGRGGGAFRTQDVYDPQTGDLRNAVEIHMSNQEDINRVETAGCFGIPRAQWPRAKAALQRYLREHAGGATLRVYPDGSAEVVPRGSAITGPHSVPGPQSSLLPPNIGAKTSANIAANNNSSVTNNASHEVHVSNLNVHTAATDASGIARDIKPAIERTNFAMVGNYSLA